TKKITTYLSAERKTLKGAGFIAALCITIALLPVIISLATSEHFSSADTQSIDYAAYVKNLSPEQQAQFTQMEADGKAIESELIKLGLNVQIIKAQVIYLTYFNYVERDETFFSDYCSCFEENDNKTLINVLNQKYNLNIDYEEFMQSYTVISNITINDYLFTDAATKNKHDLAAWARNAYVSGWAYQQGAIGEMDAELRYRCAYNTGLILGYLRYNPTEKVFGAEPSILYYTIKGNLDTMPDEEGVVLFDGTNFGVYVGSGEVVFSSADSGCVTKASVADGAWNQWAEVTGIQYNMEIVFEEYDETLKNNLGLVEWAKQAQENGWGYVYGTYGNVLTEELLQNRASMFGEQVTGFEDFIRQNWLGKRTVDCVGLIKGYGWYDSASGEIVVGSNGMADVSANGMFEAATVKGTIDTIPEVPGLAVWQDGHIGIYIGNGEVIEAMGTEQGVVKTMLPSGWSHWLEIPYISYPVAEEPTTESTEEGV
ncbi:MAG: hypothetical protein IJA12_08195, partial [Oscillospiraceae bacterium]|nr:hypothetical protein [Oscillospiraceae bacterium]